MSPSRASLLALLPALTLVLAAPRPALGGDDAPPAMRTERFDLTPFRAPPPVAGPVLFVPSDAAISASGSLHDLPEDGEPIKLFTFSEPPYERVTLSSDALAELIKRSVPGAFEKEGTWIRAESGAVYVRADDATLAKVAQAVAFAGAGLAPTLPAKALLVARDGSNAVRTVAAGGAALLPRRWTRVWIQRSVRRFAAGYDIEIAQESSANDPLVQPLPEGSELYLRWTPGETLSLVEVWTGTLEHLDAPRVDLSPMRNTPEGNTMGTIELPRTAVRRAFTALAVPSAGGAAELAWDGPDGGRTLRLSFGSAVPPPRDLDVGQDRRYAAVRAGAVAASLEQDVRPDGSDAFVERVASLRTPEPKVEPPSVDSHAGGAFLLCEGLARQLDSIRAEVAEAEALLAGATLELRAVSVPEAALREALEAGDASVGAALAPKGAELVESSGVVVAAVRVPLVAEIKASLRAGTSETALADFEAEVAQQVSAIVPQTHARFAGLYGEALAHAGADGTWTLDLEGALSWARHDGASVELAFRPPVGMAYSNQGPTQGAKPEDPTVRRVKIPIGTFGDSRISASAPFAAADVAAGRPVLLAVLSRGGGEGLPDTVVLLASLRR